MGYKEEYLKKSPEERKQIENYYLSKGYVINPNGKWGVDNETVFAAAGGLPKQEAYKMDTKQPGSFETPNVQMKRHQVDGLTNIKPNQPDNVEATPFAKAQQSQTQKQQHQPPQPQQYNPQMAQQGYNPIAAYLEYYRPQKDEAREKRLKQATRINALGNVLSNIVSFAGAKRGGLVSPQDDSAVKYGINSLQHFYDQNEQRENQWDMMGLQQMIQDQRIKENMGFQEGMLDKKFDQQNQTLIDNFGREKELIGERAEATKDVNEERYKWMGELEETKQIYRKEFAQIDQEYKIALKEMDYTKAINAIKQKDKYQTIKDGLVLYDDTLQAQMVVDEGQLNRIFGMLSQIDADAKTEIDLLMTKWGDSFTKEQKKMIVSKYWQKLIAHPDFDIEELYKKDPLNEEANGQSSPSGTAYPK